MKETKVSVFLCLRNPNTPMQTPGYRPEWIYFLMYVIHVAHCRLYSFINLECENGNELHMC